MTNPFTQQKSSSHAPAVVVVAQRVLFDGVRVSISADGKISDPLYVWFGRVHASRLWEVIDNLCLYTAAEVRAAIAKGGEWSAARRPPRRRREHHHSCQCGQCGGSRLSPGWIPASIRWAR